MENKAIDGQHPVTTETRKKTKPYNNVRVGDVHIQSNEPLCNVMDTVKKIFEMKKQVPTIQIVDKRTFRPSFLSNE
jgi:uncharacterized protein (UPF0218 family)